MRRNQVVVYVHYVWATWNRQPLLDESVRSAVYRSIGATCAELGAEVIAIGGVEDHVHLLVLQPATHSLADLMRHVKGSSAHLVTHRLEPHQDFKWQGGYGAFSVSPDAVATVCDYIAHQPERHHVGRINPDWEYDPISTPPSG